MTFDEAVFSKALADDPEGTAAFVQRPAARVETAATAAADPYDGTLTKKIASQESLVTNFADQIAKWDVRLEMRRATLQTTYSNLEVALSNLQAQSTWLTSQARLAVHELEPRSVDRVLVRRRAKPLPR
ncbi:flagellar filament capping protein FliD [Demequina litorisediminis]|uniref:Flagellar hook-associated protein 2 C-terminal domain-containing protein n=1 Tax=Demequina litorisediminis TaxID=1849022 RepID=A0ABQ6IEE2_9MICO|nr:flagellar filament capping protein FliD [Demequina litorisediminis]GMA35670.1 hypothetical protein GCM10025876_18740 [Demequina litorisediminis]